MQSAGFEKLIFEHIFIVRKTKRITTVDGLAPRRYEDIKGIVASEIGPKIFGTFEKQAPGHSWTFSNSLIIHEEKPKHFVFSTHFSVFGDLMIRSSLHLIYYFKNGKTVE